jgi:DNA polymerase-3 subunit delta'
VREFFPGLYGNDKTKARLGNAILTGKLPHALLITGDEGSGKTTLSYEIAAAINCERRGDQTVPLPCRCCTTCKRIYENGFTDVSFLRRASGKATIGVDEVRAFREDMFLSATEADKKIYIIEEADKLTPNAQNALLKVLEEPPTDLIIMLICESADDVLTTIKSRAQTVSMQRFEPTEIEEYLKMSKNGTATLPAGQATRETLMSADGRIGRAIELLSQGAESGGYRELCQRIVTALQKGSDYATLYTALTSLPQKRAELSEALEELIGAVRDLLLLKFDPDAPLVFYAEREAARELCAAFSSKRLLGIYDLISGALAENKKNANVPALIANLSARIRLI